MDPKKVSDTLVKSEIEQQEPKKKFGFWLPVTLILLIAVIVLGIIRILHKPGETPVKNNQHTETVFEPKFTKEGELFFINQSDTSKRRKIDIEIADNETDREKGLMFRRSMADTQGMLFIFEDSQPRSFWMRNTYIPLDIVFVNWNLDIITIQKNAVPFSEASVPSNGNAKYVVEVNAGYADSYGLRPGDKIRFIAGSK
jgi:uncharacterized protein